MPRIFVYPDGQYFDIWIALGDSDPLEQHESFIIGVGSTLDAAKADAVATLQTAILDVMSAKAPV